MKENATAITILCSHLSLSEGLKPISTKEWGIIVAKLLTAKKEPSDILHFSDDDFKQYFNSSAEEILRFRKLFERSGALTFELSKYNDLGIYVVTRADETYPERLKKTLKNTCPPLFYVAGNLSLLEEPAVGFVGSRTVGESEEAFTVKTVDTVNKKGYLIVSGGAKGVDGLSTQRSLENEKCAIEFVSDTMMKKMRSKQAITALQNEKLLMLSAAKPEARFSVGFAMGRNPYIYAQSQGTVVVRSDFEKGGTWSGATEALKNNLSPVFCWENKRCKGNMAIIDRGAIPITEDWDGNLNDVNIQEQLSLFPED